MEMNPVPILQAPDGMSSINRTFFFFQVGKQLYQGTLRQPQVDGFNVILNEWEQHYAASDDRWLAYALATAYHETDSKMQPIEEYGRGRGHPYGKPDPVTGKTYYGRGLVQLTWKRNYEVLGKAIGVDLVGHPSLALDLFNSVKVMFVGMMKGLFTGKSLDDYFNPTVGDWVNARKIINGVDKSNLIAGYGHQFYSAISYKT